MSIETIETIEPIPTSPATLLSGVGRDVVWSYVSVAAMTVVTLAIPAFVIRSLGASTYGVYALITAAAALSAPVDVALSLAVSRAAARYAVATDEARRPERDLLSASHAMYGTLARVTGIITAAASVAAVAGLIPVGGESRWHVALLLACVGIGISVTAATATYAGVLIGSRRFRTMAAAAVAGAITTCALLALLLGRVGVVALGGAVLAGVVVNRVVVVRSGRRLAPWLAGVNHAVRRAPDYQSQRRRVLGFALPLVVVGVGGQIVATTDVFVLGVFVSTATIGVFRAASLLPTQAIGLVYRGYDACFPALAASHDPYDQERAVALLTRIACFGCGAAFGTMALLAPDVLHVLIGSASDLGVTVLRIFAAVWCVNAAMHGLALLLIARGHQRTLAPLVGAEAVANLLLTFVLISRFGAAGAAWATLVTIVPSNLIILPALTRRYIRRPYVLVMRDGVAFTVLGLALAAAVLAAMPHITLSMAAALALKIAVVALVATPVGAAVIRWSGSPDTVGSAL